MLSISLEGDGQSAAWQRKRAVTVVVVATSSASGGGARSKHGEKFLNEGDDTQEGARVSMEVLKRSRNEKFLLSCHASS